MKQYQQKACFLGLVVAAFGCGDAGDSGEGPSDFAGLGTERQAIEEGTVVNNNGILPYSATVRIGPAPAGAQDAGFAVCSGLKVGPTRYLTAAHCVDAWTGNQVGQAYVTNSTNPNEANPPNTDLYRVLQVHVHPTWLAAGTSETAIRNKDFIGRPYDIAMFDVDRTNGIGTLASGGVPKVNVNFVDETWISRMSTRPGSRG